MAHCSQTHFIGCPDRETISELLLGGRTNLMRNRNAGGGERRAAHGMSSATSITMRMPITIRQRGGRRLVVVPDGTRGWGWSPTRGRVDSTLAKALARAHR